MIFKFSISKFSISKPSFSKPSISKLSITRIPASLTLALMIPTTLTLALTVMSANLTSAQNAQAGDAQTGNAQKGAALFKSTCTHCHSDQQGVNHRGPSLYGVVGRPAGQIPDYKYSSAMKSSGKTWDPATLSQFLSGPKDLVPGTKMSIHPITNEQDRTDIIAYLATLHQ